MAKGTCKVCGADTPERRGSGGRLPTYCVEHQTREAGRPKRPDRHVPAAREIIPCAHCGESFEGAKARRYCSEPCRAKAKYDRLRSDPDRWSAYLERMRQSYVSTPRSKIDRRCEAGDCDSKHFAKGMCRKHYYRARWADGKDGAASPTVVLNAMCYRWGASAPKVKAIKCLHTVGILPDCPMCDRLMSPLSPDHFMCRSCWTEAKFNAEEVAWLASQAATTTPSALRSTPLSRQTVRSSAA